MERYGFFDRLAVTDAVKGFLLAYVYSRVNEKPSMNRPVSTVKTLTPTQEPTSVPSAVPKITPVEAPQQVEVITVAPKPKVKQSTELRGEQAEIYEAMQAHTQREQMRYEDGVQADAFLSRAFRHTMIAD